MSRKLTRQLVGYRLVLVAIANGAITWVILIIAPLGLLAVISCTVLVVLASLVTGYVGDLALMELLRSVDPQLGQAMRDRDTLRSRYREQARLDEEERRSLPRRDE